MNNKMSINTNQQLNLKDKKMYKQKQNQTHRYREHFDGCQMGGELGGWVKKGKGLRCRNW